MTAKNYRNIFFGFLLSVILVFLYVRPLNSPWQPFIAGDGLGYYSYLPATFIYNDTNYEFKWFNGAHNANYVYSSFKNPEDNLLVDFKGKRINKYYPGLAVIWTPFFIAGHLCAVLFNFEPDGFSLPYQLAIGVASLFYLLLGLFYLRKLLLKLFNSHFAALVVPVVLFYGTWLYPYAIHYNSLSHIYSFTFIILFLYSVVNYFQGHDQKLRYFLFSFLFLVICVCIRPLTGLIVLTIPLFMPPGFFRERWFRGKFRAVEFVTLALSLCILIFNLAISLIQTGTIFTNTYQGERFDFQNSRFFDALFSYYMGLFVYVPLIFISLFGLPFLKRPQRIFLPLFFFFIIFLYSSWWYWPIIKRATIDFYIFPAIFLASLLHAYPQRKIKKGLLILLGICVLYFQFKNMQIRKGILDEFLTYKELYWQNFFQNRKDAAIPYSSGFGYRKKSI